MLSFQRGHSAAERKGGGGQKGRNEEGYRMLQEIYQAQAQAPSGLSRASAPYQMRLFQQTTTLPLVQRHALQARRLRSLAGGSPWEIR